MQPEVERAQAVRDAQMLCPPNHWFSRGCCSPQHLWFEATLPFMQTDGCQMHYLNFHQRDETSVSHNHINLFAPQPLVSLLAGLFGFIGFAVWLGR